MFKNKLTQSGFRRWILIASGVILVLLIIVTTVVILKAVKAPTEVAMTGVPASRPVSNPKALLAGYTTAGSIAAFTPNYQMTSAGVDGAPVYYQSEGQTFVVQTPSSFAITYSAPAHHADDTASIKTQTDAYMKEQGLTRTTLATKSQTITSRVTYTDSKNVCQLSSMPPTKDFGGVYTLACIDKTAIQTEYKATQGLIDLYKRAVDANLKPTEADRSYNHTEGDKSLTVLAIKTDEGTTQQLFAAINNVWEFIVTLDGGTGSTNGKYSSDPAVTKALQNPKYDGFLAKNLWL